MGKTIPRSEFMCELCKWADESPCASPRHPASMEAYCICVGHGEHTAVSKCEPNQIKGSDP